MHRGANNLILFIGCEHRLYEVSRTNMKLAKISYIPSIQALVAIFLADHVLSRPVCKDDEYWQFITGKCEPCSHICDPPRRHENDCPKRCPNYHPTTSTTLPSTTLPSQILSAVSQSPRTPQQIDIEAGGNDTMGLPWYWILAIVAGGVVIQISLGCVVCKKRKVCLRRDNAKPDPESLYPVTVKQLEHPMEDLANRDDQHVDQEQQNMLPQNEIHENEEVK